VAAERDGGPAHAARRRSPPFAMSAGSAQTERVHAQAPWDRPPTDHARDTAARPDRSTPQTKQRTAPEPRITADTVVRVRQKGPSPLIAPQLPGAISKLFPDLDGAPVLLLLRDEVSPLDHENPCRTARERVRNRAAARTSADNDDVVVGGHRE
jgi:hypothetical protein